MLCILLFSYNNISWRFLRFNTAIERLPHFSLELHCTSLYKTVYCCTLLLDTCVFLRFTTTNSPAVNNCTLGILYFSRCSTLGFHNNIAQTGLFKQKCFLTFLEGQRLDQSVSIIGFWGELSSWLADCWPSPCCVFTWWGERASLLVSSLGRALPSWAHLNILISQTPHLQVTSLRGWECQHTNFGEDTSQSLAAGISSIPRNRIADVRVSIHMQFIIYFNWIFDPLGVYPDMCCEVWI